MPAAAPAAGNLELGLHIEHPGGGWAAADCGIAGVDLVEFALGLHNRARCSGRRDAPRE